MKRDMDLCRAILFAVENLEGRSVLASELKTQSPDLLSGWDDTQVLYHSELLTALATQSWQKHIFD